VLSGVPVEARLLKEDDLRPGRPGGDVRDRRPRWRPPTTPSSWLVAYCLTRDIKRAFRSARGSRPAWSALNQGPRLEPVGAVRRRQAVGFGREGGAEGIDEYLEVKYVAMDLM
jgi:succinate-semialdehyde dehydrogenase/glutarate-semialdehyde dehydrogenase